MQDKSTIIPNNSITFLGTAGARWMVISQILASGGMWLNLEGTQILLDPGPGCLVQVAKMKLNPALLSGIIVSHRHLDHAADVNIMVEAMTHGGTRQQGKLFAPADALDSEPILFSYLKKYLEGVEVLQQGNQYAIGNISFTTPIKHIHQVETYGMTFTTAKHTLSYIADSRYFAGLENHYGGQLLIINAARLKGDRPYDHLSVPDVKRIITSLKPKVAILTHFGMTMWRAKPWLIAQQLSQETGIEVIAARDGMNYELSRLEEQVEAPE